MKNRNRFLDTLNFRKPEDRLPMIEWAEWWDLTLENWRNSGVCIPDEPEYLREELGLDLMRQFWIRPVCPGTDDTLPPIIFNREDYLRLKKTLYNKDIVIKYLNKMYVWKEQEERGEAVLWLTLGGHLGWPRRLFGGTNIYYAFYDFPELFHEINQDLVEFNLFVIEEACKIIKPVFLTFGEDMSYNHGPMFGRDLFDEFLKPYYLQTIPALKKNNIIPMVDTDGYFEEMIPWLIDSGIEGSLPIERQAGCDPDRIRMNYPKFKMIGGYNKMVMSKGEDAMIKEFERLLPAMKTGGFIPACDHQTPPDVSFEDYKTYVRLLETYCKLAVQA